MLGAGTAAGLSPGLSHTDPSDRGQMAPALLPAGATLLHKSAAPRNQPGSDAKGYSQSSPCSAQLSQPPHRSLSSPGKSQEISDFPAHPPVASQRRKKEKKKKKRKVNWPFFIMFTLWCLPMTTLLICTTAISVANKRNKGWGTKGKLSKKGGRAPP